MKVEDRLKDAMLTLRTAAMSIKTWADCEKTIDQYALIMLGEKPNLVNAINSYELVHSLNAVFSISIDLNELNRLLPAVCEKLRMAFEPMPWGEEDGVLEKLIYDITLFV